MVRLAVCTVRIIIGALEIAEYATRIEPVLPDLGGSHYVFTDKLSLYSVFDLLIFFIVLIPMIGLRSRMDGRIQHSMPTR